MPGEHVLELPLQVGARDDAIDEVGTIEAADELDGIAKLELGNDVAPDARGGSCRERVQADAGEPRAHGPELPVLGPEIVPPLTDAVRLVDGDEREPVGAGPEQGEEAL